MTWLLSLIPTQYKLIAEGILAAFLFLAGWYAHGVWDGYIANSSAEKAITAANKTSTDIITFNSNLAKEKVNAKNDACLDKPIPVNIRGLLNH